MTGSHTANYGMRLLCALSGTAQLPAHGFYSYERKPEKSNGRAAIRNRLGECRKPESNPNPRDCKLKSAWCVIEPGTVYNSCRLNIKEMGKLSDNSRRKQIERKTPNAPQTWGRRSWIEYPGGRHRGRGQQGYAEIARSGKNTAHAWITEYIEPVRHCCIRSQRLIKGDSTD